VDFISGPSLIFAFSNFIKGKTTSFTLLYLKTGSFKLNSLIFLPAEILAASFARGIPIALLIKGTVLDARGFTSSMYMVSSLIANCILIKPLTFNPRAISFVYFLILFKTFS